jgi:23S rRNA (uracil1939-C5)-methyltransferase
MLDPEPAIVVASSPSRFVVGTYRVRVETLDEGGVASGHVVAPLEPASPADLARVHHTSEAAAPEPAEFTFIGGLPGEIVDLEVRWSLPREGRRPSRRIPPPSVRVIGVVTPAAERVSAPCPVFGVCGGCQFQHLSYPAQLEWKTERVRAALATAGLGNVVVEDAIGCAEPWGYRNHMRFSVNREGRAGLTARGSHRVLELTNCPIAHPVVNVALAAVRDVTLSRPQLVVRVGDATGQIMLQPAPPAPVTERLTAAGLDVRESEMDERLLETLFRIRPSSFFQTNTAQANRMAEIVLSLLPAGPDITLVDAYCGVGVFAALMAHRAGRVIAIEESASAIRDAQWNLRAWANVEIVKAKVEDALPTINASVDGLVIDPPRAGCQRSVLDTLCAYRVPRVIYVSCNPDTLARDLAILCRESAAYRVVCVQPLDMFPQTAHIETIVALEAVE